MISPRASASAACAIDAARVALALALDEQRAGAADQPADHRPARELRLGDEAHRLHRIERDDVEPRDMIGDDQNVAARVRERSGQPCVDAEHAQQTTRPAPDHHAALRRRQKRQDERRRGNAFEHVRAGARDPVDAKRKRRRARTRAARRDHHRIAVRAPSHPALERLLAESLGEDRGDDLAVDGVVLPASRRDLDRAEHRRELSGALPVPAARDAIEQPGAIGVAATGRIDDRRRWHGGNRVACCRPRE